MLRNLFFNTHGGSNKITDCIFKAPSTQKYILIIVTSSKIKVCAEFDIRRLVLSFTPELNVCMYSMSIILWQPNTVNLWTRDVETYIFSARMLRTDFLKE